VSLTTSLLTEDGYMFLPPQHTTLGRRLFGDVSVILQDRTEYTHKTENNESHSKD